MVTRVSFASNNGHVNLTKRSCKINRKRKFVAKSTTLLCSHLHSKAFYSWQESVKLRYHVC